MNYLDSNVFIYAATDDGQRGKAATAVLRKALKEGAFTASLTADEVLWAIGKKLGRDIAAAKARQMLRLEMTIVPVDGPLVEAALAHYEAGLDPRDAIHAAAALRSGCKRILSTDPDFAAVKGLRHVTY